MQLINIIQRSVLIIAALAVVGCAGGVEYTPPSPITVSTVNEKIIDKQLASVWKSSVAELGKKFFVINNIDRASGLINVSYTGSPEQYIDCGRIYSYVSNARGERTYEFEGSSADINYEVMKGALFGINRRMELEGRINLIFEALSSKRTKVTVNTRYVVTRTQTVQNVAGGMAQRFTHTISFNTGNSASFPAGTDGAASCQATGKLEKEVLQLIN